MLETKRSVASNPQIVGGTPVFVGTRVPLQTLTNHGAGGYKLDGILKRFPRHAREQACGARELSLNARANDAFVDPRPARPESAQGA